MSTEGGHVVLPGHLLVFSKLRVPKVYVILIVGMPMRTISSIRTHSSIFLGIARLLLLNHMSVATTCSLPHVVGSRMDNSVWSHTRNVLTCRH